MQRALYNVKVRSTMGGSVGRSTLKLPILFRAAALGPTSSSLLLATYMLPLSANMTEVGWYRPCVTGILRAQNRTKHKNTCATTISEVREKTIHKQQRENERTRQRSVAIASTKYQVLYFLFTTDAERGGLLGRWGGGGVQRGHHISRILLISRIYTSRRTVAPMNGQGFVLSWKCNIGLVSGGV